ncbi:MAG TPA: ComEC/Rec2 family competence protein [Rhizomicrobium sp.]|nr:ComEC/Rec2 family competence protein [Rhizomicrobium sp.]
MLGAGAAAYFALFREPGVAMAWMALAGAGVLALAAVPGFARAPLALAAALLLGLGLAKLREEEVATPVLDHGVIAHLTGRVRSLEPRETGLRLVLENVRSGAFAPGRTPRRIRVALRGQPGIHPGDWLSLTARLDSPPVPVEPGAADLGRSLFFQSIGAVGFTYGRARVIMAAGSPDMMQRVRQQVETLRESMTRRIKAVLPGSTGGVATAIITGMRGGIAEEDEAALRDAGLAHVLAIAGLHMALVGGGLFWLIRALLAAVPVLALNWPIKKWAAGAALAAASFYLVISGAAPPSVRAFVMFAVAMCAVLLDRPALSMRSLALAAAILLLLRPESIAEAGFQMSFAAVAALVAVAEWAQRRRRGVPRGLLARYGLAIFLTSLVGSLATWPFTLFHFGRAARYAVMGNLIAMPVMGFWVMPAAALSVMLMPLGLDAPALHLLGAGIDIMVAMSRWVSALPGAVSLSPAMPLAALMLMALGGLWCAIWQRRARWWGLGPVALGVVLAFLAPRPDMLVAGDGLTVALRGDDGRLHFVRKPKDRFAARAWLRRDGDGRDIADAVGMPGLRCDGVGCAVRKDGVMIAASTRPEALGDDCVRAQVLVSAVTVDCKGPAVVIGTKQAAAGEGWRVTLSSPPHADSVRAWRGDRPWVPAVNTGG